MLDLSAKVYETFGATILRPTDLIIHLDGLRREVEYAPQRLAGTLSEIRLVQAGQEDNLTEKFQAAALGASKSSFKSHLRTILADPDRNACYVAFAVNKEPIALFALNRTESDTLEIPLIRIARGPVATTLVRYVIFWAVVPDTTSGRVLPHWKNRYGPN